MYLWNDLLHGMFVMFVVVSRIYREHRTKVVMRHDNGRLFRFYYVPYTHIWKSYWWHKRVFFYGPHCIFTGEGFDYFARETRSARSRDIGLSVAVANNAGVV